MRILLVIAFAVMTQGCSNEPYTKFLSEFQAGADCPALFELRNAAKQGASPAIEADMNTKLRSIQCFSSSSSRADVGPSNTGAFTVQEYRLYRAVISAPRSVSEARAIENAARQYGVTAVVVRLALTRVQDALSKNGWLATPNSEIRHATDRKGESP